MSTEVGVANSFKDVFVGEEYGKQRLVPGPSLLFEAIFSCVNFYENKDFEKDSPHGLTITFSFYSSRIPDEFSITANCGDRYK